MAIAAMNRQAYRLQFDNLGTSTARTAQTGFCRIRHTYLPQLFFLGFFHDDYLVGVTYTLSLVGLRFTVSTYFRRDLTYLLLVYSLNKNFGLTWRFHLHTFRHFMGHGVRKPQCQVKNLSCCLGTITHTHQRQFFFETVSYSADHISQQRARCTGHRVSLLGTAGRLYQQIIAFTLNGDV